MRERVATQRDGDKSCHGTAKHKRCSSGQGMGKREGSPQEGSRVRVQRARPQLTRTHATRRARPARRIIVGGLIGWRDRGIELGTRWPRHNALAPRLRVCDRRDRVRTRAGRPTGAEASRKAWVMGWGLWQGHR